MRSLYRLRSSHPAFLPLTSTPIESMAQVFYAQHQGTKPAAANISLSFAAEI
jgi:hypothetical protein